MTLLGFVGAAVAIVCYGCNYVVVKHFPTGDGIIFQWTMSIGILCVGFIAPLFHEFVFVASGLLGGALWGTGNLMVVPIIQRIGLGLGFLLWSMGNLLLGFCVGKFGWFGVTKDSVRYPALNWLGAALGVVSLSLNFFIRPTLKEEQKTKAAAVEEEDEDTPLLPLPEYRRIVHRIFGKTSGPDRIRWMSGVAMALLAGCLYGVSLAPFQRWYDKEQEAHKHPGALDFAFSHFSGIFLLSTGYTLAYILVKHNRPQVFAQSILPGFVSGAMWGTATTGWMVTNAYLGMSTGYPLVVMGPSFLTAFWSVCVYHEIQGTTNYTFLCLALLFNLACVLCVTFSRV